MSGRGKAGKGLGKGASMAHPAKKAKKEEEEAHKWVMHTKVALVSCVSEEGMELKPTLVPLKALPMFFQTAIKKQQDAQPKEDEKVVDFDINLCDEDSFECITQYVSRKALSEELGINDDDEEEEGEEDEDEEEEAFDDFDTLRDHLVSWIDLLPLKFAKLPTVPILTKARIEINKLDQ